LHSLLVSNIGRTRYADAWALQQRLWQLRHSGMIGDVLLINEHEHVYTLGKSSDENHLLASDEELKSAGTDIFRIDRGGDVTYHGPGQIVGYSILDLHNYFLDIHRYLRSIEEVLIRVLASFGVKAGREEGMTGVWVEGEKIAAIGVKVSRWITMHGFALNVNTDLSRFNRIIPCGIFHKGVTSMEKIAGRTFELDSVEKVLIDSFSEVFGCSVRQISFIELESEVKSMEALQTSSAILKEEFE
jgi:lipoyl(octanoyl) transferase